jgi:histidinol phosphatase-like PHP family hydrolase
MKTSNLTILLISDFHYINNAEHECNLEDRKSSLARTLLRKVFLRLKHMQVKPDLTILLGDLVDNGLAVGADGDLGELIEELKESGIPYLAASGNHDVGRQQYAEAFECQPGFHRFGDYGFLVFNDSVAEGDITTRQDDVINLPQVTTAAHPDTPLIALQHNPIYPDIECGYPYMPTNVDAIRKSYEESNVFLSLSGHYHLGQAAAENNGVTYHTVKALCESPFECSIIYVDDTNVTVKPLKLNSSVCDLTDIHCHTEYAYCSTTVAAENNIKMAKAMGLSQLYLTEHAFHLYCDLDVACSFAWQHDKEMIAAIKKSSQGRMEEYKRFAFALRAQDPDFVKLGLEVDLCADGTLLLRDSDRHGWDILVGAIHNIPGFIPNQTSQVEAEKFFIRDLEKLLVTGIDVLAHPFRFFLRSGLESPAHLYEEVAALLASHDVAVEINYHTNAPAVSFIQECLKHEVKIAFGSDSHDIAEVGEFYPHLQLLKEVGITESYLPSILSSFRMHASTVVD